jgi:5S rRNA maturation endonuclease (ribonuclease M5)
MVEELAKSKKKNKVIIVLCDGDTGGVKSDIEDAKKMGIKTYGIGIDIDLSGDFESSKEIKDVKELGGVMYDLLKKTLNI